MIREGEKGQMEITTIFIQLSLQQMQATIGWVPKNSFSAPQKSLTAKYVCSLVETYLNLNRLLPGVIGM